MKQHTKLSPFPWLPLAAGLIGCCLRSWLLSAAEENGLLPYPHPANTMSFILLAVTLGLCFILICRTPDSTSYPLLFPSSRMAATGSILSGIGVGCSALSAPDTGLLFLPLIMLGAISAICLGIAAYLRFHAHRPHCLLHCIPAAYLMLRTIAFCRMWGMEPQFQVFFFDLLASLFVLIACYYRAELDARDGSYKKHLFFSQAAIFCCFLCLPGEDWLFHLSAAVWMAADFCVLPTPIPED